MTIGTPHPCQVGGVHGSLALPERDPQAALAEKAGTAAWSAPCDVGSHPVGGAVTVLSPGPAVLRPPAEAGSRSASARRRIPAVDEEARVLAWRPLALHIARRYFIVGADPDDVRQEAMFGLLLALREYSLAGEPPVGFVAVVIERWVQTQVRAGTRLKHDMLTHALRDEARYGDDSGDTYLREIPDYGSDPALIVQARDELRRKLASFIEMSELERTSFVDVINDMPYRLNKQVDNAVQRARKKLRAA